MRFGIKRRGLSRFQILFCAIIGGLGGVYIWRPILLERIKKQQEQLKEQEQQSESPTPEGQT